ncbi:MAG: OmpP1/FadL family transporter [Myxococcales bacterium]|nr:outer membrane protein transport protein [Myxococcales bacterium]
MKNLILAVFLAPAAALAGGYVVPNVNARDVAMVGSPVAAQDSAAATYQNPAALAKLEGLNVSADVSLIDLRTTWTDPTGINSPVNTVPKAAFPPAIYAAYGFRLPEAANSMRAGVGVGFTVPGGGFVFWPGDWPGRNEIMTVDRKIFGIYATAGLQVLPQLRIGGGLIYYRTTEYLLQGLNFLGSTPGQIDLGTAGGAVSYDVSAEVTPVKDLPLTVALDYKHQAVQTLSGHAHGENVPLALQPRLLDQAVTHVLTYPNQLNIAVAYNVIQPLLLAFDWTLERQVVYVNDTFTGDRGVTVVVPRNYTNDWTLRLGGEYQVLPLLRVRAGVEYDHAPQPSYSISPTLPTANTWDVGLGAGYTVVPGLEINAGYFHAFYEKSTATGPESFPGTYDTNTNIYALNITWKMGASK